MLDSCSKSYIFLIMKAIMDPFSTPPNPAPFSTFENSQSLLMQPLQPIGELMSYDPPGIYGSTKSQTQFSDSGLPSCSGSQSQFAPFGNQSSSMVAF